jgi:hypothetical protein
MDERYPGTEEKIVAYIMGYDSLKAIGGNKDSCSAKEVIDARLRMDGLFDQEEHADGFVQEFIALYTNGPAGGGGIRYIQLGLINMYALRYALHRCLTNIWRNMEMKFHITIHGENAILFLLSFLESLKQFD